MKALQFLYEHHHRDCIDLSHIMSKVITEKENVHIMALPLELESKEAIQSVHADSSLGPNGFGSSFYLSCLDFLKDDLMEAIV